MRIGNCIFLVLIVGVFFLLEACTQPVTIKEQIPETTEQSNKSAGDVEPIEQQHQEPEMASIYIQTAEISKPEVLTPAHELSDPETSFFRSTANQLDARAFDVCLEGFMSSECFDDSRDQQSCPMGVFSVMESDDYLEIKVGTSANCCYAFIGDIGLLNDSTINLIFHPFGSNHCACNCGFVLTYTLKKECLVSESQSDRIKVLAVNDEDPVQLIR